MSMIHWFLTLLKVESVDIVSNRNPKSTSKFWQTLWKSMGSKLKMSITFRPQMDGQIERVNLFIQQFLLNYVAANQQDWVDHLELTEFYYKHSEHSTSGSTPFRMVTSKSPIVPTTSAALGQPPSDAIRKCQWSRNLMKKDGVCGRWLRPILKRCINDTKNFRTSLDER